MADLLTLMAVHAHPDDESSSTGGVLARYSAEGLRTVLVTCTNGEFGDGPDHVKPGQEGHDEDQVAKTRLAELDRAVEHLGVSHAELLGYHDSGMPDWPYKERPDVFCNIPFEEPVGRLLELLEQYRPDVIVTYHDLGGYNHPDHRRAHQITVKACEMAGDVAPRKLYFIARRPRDWDKLRDRLREAGVEVPVPPPRQNDEDWRRRMEQIERSITTTVDTSAVADRKQAALAAHASQLDQSWWIRFPSESIIEVFGEESFIRAQDRTNAPVPEDDLFAGLR